MALVPHSDWLVCHNCFFSRDIPTIYATQDAVRKKKIVFDFRSFVATMLLAINAGVVGEGANPSADLVADDGDADDDTDDVAAVDVLMALLMVLMLLPFVVVAGSQGICRGDYNTFQLRILLLLLLVSAHQPAT